MLKISDFTPPLPPKIIEGIKTKMKTKPSIVEIEGDNVDPVTSLKPIYDDCAVYCMYVGIQANVSLN